MTPHPNPADLAAEQIAEVERLFAAFPHPLIDRVLAEARENVRREKRE